jgi:hypothetical protein
MTYILLYMKRMQLILRLTLRELEKNMACHGRIVFFSHSCISFCNEIQNNTL